MQHKRAHMPIYDDDCTWLRILIHLRVKCGEWLKEQGKGVATGGVRIDYPPPAVVVPHEQPHRLLQLLDASTETATAPFQPSQVRA